MSFPKKRKPACSENSSLSGFISRELTNAAEIQIFPDMRIPLLFALAAGALLVTSTSRAAQHLWDFQEIYTNSDGTIQFIEMQSDAASQQFLNGFTITEKQGATILNTFTFNANLLLNSPLAGHPNTASSTLNQTMLIATANFTSLYGVVPDYIIPAGFLTAGAGRTLNFNISPAEVVNLDTLPTDGVMSLDAMSANDTPSAVAINSIANPSNFRPPESAFIPEPASALLAASGLLLLAVRRRRQSAAR